MGRRDLSQERRAAILDAAAECIRRFGLEMTTLERIAAQAGVQRPIIRHYIGNRDDLLAALIEHLTERYRRDYETLAAKLSQRHRVQAMLKFLFAGDFLAQPDEDAVIDALLAAAAKNRRARNCLRGMYEAFENTCYTEFRSAYPNASPRRVRAIAYAVMCLAEENASLIRLGFPAERSAAARRAAELLIGSLAPLKKTPGTKQ